MDTNANPVGRRLQRARDSSIGTAGRTSRLWWRVGHRPHRTTTILLASGNASDWRLWYSSTPLADTDWLRDIAGEFIGDQSRASLWFASAGVRASLHFDASPNIVLTLTGVKKVALVSSTQWRRLSLYPVLHPAARQSRIDDATHLAALGEFTEIARGEALYLPPLYLHAVQTATDEPALSVNAYLSDDAKAAARDLSSGADFSKLCGKCALIHFALAAALSPTFVHDVVTSRYNGLEEDYAYFVSPLHSIAAHALRVGAAECPRVSRPASDVGALR